MSDLNEKNNIENSDENNNTPADLSKEYDGVTDVQEQLPKKPKRISLQTFVVSSVALVLAAVMLTYTLCSATYGRLLNEAYLGNVSQGKDDGYGKLDLVRAIFEKYSYLDINDEDYLDAVIRAYVAETGDRYAVYYNADEYAEHLNSVSGNTVGIGITVVSEVVNVDGVDYNVMNVVSVTEGGTAEAAGVKVGDKIAWIGSGENEKLVGDMIDYNAAVNAIRGEEGTFAEFSVLRYSQNGYEKISFSVERKSIEVPTVSGRVSATDKNVAVVRITQFNYNTPAQFVQAVDSLLLKGCKYFVFDVRGNPGGSLDSVVATLSYLLPADTTLLSTVDANGTTEITKVKPITDLEGALIDCNVSKEDIAKYQGKIAKLAVLCDGNSASAAELFTANVRDHNLGIIVGQKSFGKGSMQTVFSLAPYGYTGGLRLTTRMYFPPCGESYDGIGIEPTENYKTELSEKAKEYSLDALPEEIDDQLLAAIRSFE